MFLLLTAMIQKKALNILNRNEYKAYLIGEVIRGKGKVRIV